MGRATRLEWRSQLHVECTCQTFSCEFTAPIKLTNSHVLWKRQYVTCDSNQHVTMLNLHAQQVLGTIPGIHTNTRTYIIHILKNELLLSYLRCSFSLMCPSLTRRYVVPDSIGGLSYMGYLYMDQNTVRRCG